MLSHSWIRSAADSASHEHRAIPQRLVVLLDILGAFGVPVLSSVVEIDHFANYAVDRLMETQNRTTVLDCCRTVQRFMDKNSNPCLAAVLGLM
jgi:hypothetical protein